MTVLTEAHEVGPTTGVRPVWWRRHRATMLIVGALVLAVLVLVLFGTHPTRRSTPLDPDNPGPEGAQAVARVLADQGVDVTIVRSADDFDDTEVGPGTTVVVTSTERLGASTLERLRRHAAPARTVLVEPPTGVLAGFDIIGFPTRLDTDHPVPADCSVDLFDGLTLEVDDAEGYEGAGCFGDADGSAYLPPPGGGGADDVALFGAGDALTNDQVLRADNAAVALRLLGQDDRLVWYVASYDDLVGDDGVDVTSLLPDWIGTGLAIVTLTVLLLALWRGRRLGALATEPLPVSIKAIETTRSRGRLYRRAGDRAHAAEALRDGTRRRAAERLHLGRGIDQTDLIRAVARHVGRSEEEAGRLLSSSAPIPGSDRDLIHLANSLAALEEEVRRS